MIMKSVFHSPARIPAGSPRGQIVRRAAKRKTLFIIKSKCRSWQSDDSKECPAPIARNARP